MHFKSALCRVYNIPGHCYNEYDVIYILIYKGEIGLRDKGLVILNFLSTQEDWVTSFSMSAMLNISVRSIKSYISEINSQCPGLIESSRIGFLIKDKSRLSKIISQKNFMPIPQTSEDRKKYILRKLLLEENQYDLDGLAGEIFISPVTLLNELPKIKSELADFDLVLKTKNNSAFIDGQEMNKKKLISKLIYDDSKDSFLSIKSIQRYLPNFDLSLVKDMISSTLRTNHYFMDDFSLLNLVLHIAITMERRHIQTPSTDEEPVDLELLVDKNIHKIVTDMTGKIEELFEIKFLQEEVYNFALLVMTRAISDSISGIETEQLLSFVGERVVRLVSLMQKKTKETYNISITNPDFTIRFSLHIKNLLIRLEHKIELRNPGMRDIKNSYPFIYDVSVYLANIMTQETGYILSEDEISYFALHLGVLIEERKVIKYEVRAILVNPQYYFSSAEFAGKLSVAFEDNLLLIGIVTSFEEIEAYSDYDLIITTIPVYFATLKPYVHISNHLSTKDRITISKKIEDVLKNRMKVRVESKLRLMFKEDLFFVDMSLRNQNDVIVKLADTLESLGYVDSSFKNKLFERELISSSAYLNIAMPHPFEMCALNSSIAVSIHPNGIVWNGNRVNIVFLLAINIRDSLFFKDIFDFITEVISEEKKLKKILELKTYDQFISTLVSFAK